MNTKKTKEIAEEKISKVSMSHIMPINRFSVTDMFDNRKLFLHALYVQRRNVDKEYAIDRDQEKDDKLVLEGRYNKKMAIEHAKKRIEDMKAQIKALKADTELDLATKKKKIARCLEIIKNDQWTLSREIAYMQKANQR